MSNSRLHNLTQQLDITLVMNIALGNCFHVCVCCVFTLCIPALAHQLLGTLLSASHLVEGTQRVQTHMTSPGFQRVLRIQTQATQSWQVLYSAISPPPCILLRVVCATWLHTEYFLWFVFSSNSVQMCDSECRCVHVSAGARETRRGFWVLQSWS